MKKSPQSQVKERFESKEKLVAAVQELATAGLWLDRVNTGKGLARISNSKLIRLHDKLSDAKTRFGSREKLLSAIVDLNKRVKDKGFASKLANYPLPQLLDLHAAATRADKRSEKNAKAEPVKAAKPKAAAKVKASPTPAEPAEPAAPPPVAVDAPKATAAKATAKPPAVKAPAAKAPAVKAEPKTEKAPVEKVPAKGKAKKA